MKIKVEVISGSQFVTLFSKQDVQEVDKHYEQTTHQLNNCDEIDYVEMTVL